MLYINTKLPNTAYDDLSRNDKKVVCIIDGLFNDKKLNKIEIPLTSAVDLEKQSEFCADVKTLIRIQYAVYNLSSIVFSREVRKDSENKDFFVYFANRVTTADKELEKLFVEGKKSDKKRESSKKTKAKSEAKKQEKIEEEKKLDEEWNTKATSELSKYLVNFLSAKKVKLSTTDLNTLENGILTILNTTK